MPSMEYQRDGSCIVTNDAGEVLVIPAGSQAEQDAAIQAHVGPQEPPPFSLEEKVAKMAALLVEKNVVTKKDMQDATKIDTAAVAIESAEIKTG